MAEKTPAIHRDFPRWYADVAIGGDTSRRDARWSAVHTIIADADRASIEALVRLVFATRSSPQAAALTKIHDAYRAADNTFDPANAGREMQVLAGACLAILFETNSDTGAAAALCVATAALSGARTLQLPMDLMALAEAAITRMADAHRRRPSLTGLINTDPPTFDFEAAAVKAKEGNFETVAQGFTLAANAARDAFKGLATQHASAVRALSCFLQVQDEELQMLWWLTGGHSTDFQSPFDLVPAEAQPLVFAKELADMTVFLPGPRSIRPLLSRTGLKERKKLAIATAVNAADTTWLMRLHSDADPSPVTQPLHFAISRHLEAGGGESWIANWAAVVGVDATRQLSTLARRRPPQSQK